MFARIHDGVGAIKRRRSKRALLITKHTTHTVSPFVYQWSAWNSIRSIHARWAELSIEFSSYAIASSTSSNVIACKNHASVTQSAQPQNLLSWCREHFKQDAGTILSYFATSHASVLNFADASFSSQLNYCVASLLEFSSRV